MKIHLRLALILMVLLTGVAVVPTSFLRADDKPKDKNGEKPKDAKPSKDDDDDDDDASTRGRVIFKPPTNGAPAARTGGASRGPEVPRIWVYAPMETGLTISAKPKFYWYQDKPSDAKLILEIIGTEDEHPLVKVVLDGSRTQGVYSYDMASQNAELVPGVEYQWSVRLDVNPKSPSMDPFAAGWVKRVKYTDELKQRVAEARKSDLAELYAAEGLWYDTLSELGRKIDANPASRVHELRANLLDQVLLADAAKYERTLVGKK